MRALLAWLKRKITFSRSLVALAAVCGGFAFFEFAHRTPQAAWGATAVVLIIWSMVFDDDGGPGSQELYTYDDAKQYTPGPPAHAN